MRTQKIIDLLGYTMDQLEDRMLADWFQWCMDKSWVTASKTEVSAGTQIELMLHTEDLQSLVADSALFNYYTKIYADCMLDFLEDTKGMNPAPSITEARQMYKNCIMNTYRSYSMPLIKQARSKTIINYESN